MDTAVTLSYDKMLSDLSQSPPQEKVSFMIMMARRLLPIRRGEVGSTPKFTAIYKSHELLTDHVRHWLKGEISEPIEAIAPLETPDRPTYDALELEFEGTECFGNLRLVGNLITKSALYAGEIVFEQAGIDEVPQCLEE